MKRRHAPPSGFRVFLLVLGFGLLGLAIDMAWQVTP